MNVSPTMAAAMAPAAPRGSVPVMRAGEACSVTKVSQGGDGSGAGIRDDTCTFLSDCEFHFPNSLEESWHFFFFFFFFGGAGNRIQSFAHTSQVVKFSSTSLHPSPILGTF
jgi:hypothetical protein